MGVPKEDDIIVDDVAHLPVINLQEFLSDSLEQCNLVASCLSKYGVLVIKDPRVSEDDNDKFINMMERYFDSTDYKTDAKPEYSYQVGVTPPLVEKPRNHCSRIANMSDKPTTLCPPELDKKSRFFWRIGSRPTVTSFEDLNAPPVIPPAFKNEWEDTMNTWGYKMLDAVTVVAEMAAIGMNLPRNSFTSLMHNGPHLLAPTGSDFSKYGTLNTVLAGYHYDLNLMTIHGKSRFPGLFVWLRDGTKVRVIVPDGCLLVQAGKQMEILTSGNVLAGYHEVVVTSETLTAIQDAKDAGRSLHRVSSTLFSHVASDALLKPLVANEEDKTPVVLAGTQVRKELEKIQLSFKSG